MISHARPVVTYNTGQITPKTQPGGLSFTLDAESFKFGQIKLVIEINKPGKIARNIAFVIEKDNFRNLSVISYSQHYHDSSARILKCRFEEVCEGKLKLVPFRVEFRNYSFCNVREILGKVLWDHAALAVDSGHGNVSLVKVVE